jgi:hypothetical protein
VVGIVSFALTSTGGTSFLQASNSARALVQQLGLDTKPGPFQKAWSQAFNDYGSTNAGHWHKAAQEFQQLANNYPQFKGIMPYLQYAQKQAATEKQQVTPVTQTTSSKSFLTSYWPILAAGAVLVLGLLLFGVVIIQRRGAKPVLATSGQRYEASSNGNGAMANPFAPNPTGNQSYFMPFAQANQPPNTSTTFGAPSASNAPSWTTPTAFGAPSAPNAPSWNTPAPTSASPQPAQPPASAPPWMSQLSSQGTSSVESERTDFLVPWPCGHLNRRSAHFCTVCGEPAPRLPSLPPIRRYEQ